MKNINTMLNSKGVWYSKWYILILAMKVTQSMPFGGLQALVMLLGIGRILWWRCYTLRNYLMTDSTMCLAVLMRKQIFRLNKGLGLIKWFGGNVIHFSIWVAPHPLYLWVVYLFILSALPGQFSSLILYRFFFNKKNYVIIFSIVSVILEILWTHIYM